MPSNSMSRPLAGARRRAAARCRTAAHALSLRKSAKRAIGAGLACLMVAGCAKQNEEDVRTRVSSWMNLGETLYFHSQPGCSAAVFDLKSTRISSKVTRARTLQTGVKMLGRDGPVFFDIKGETPHSVSEAMMNANLHRGIGMISSGIAAKNCMTETLQTYYLRALLDENADLVYDPQEKAMIVLDGENRWLFYARGDGK